MPYHGKLKCASVLTLICFDFGDFTFCRSWLSSCSFLNSSAFRLISCKMKGKHIIAFVDALNPKITCFVHARGRVHSARREIQA